MGVLHRRDELDECAAHEKVVLAVVAAGLVGPGSSLLLPGLAELHAMLWATRLRT